MACFHRTAFLVMMSLGVALLLGSVLLAPTSFAQSGGTGDDCTKCAACVTDNGCISQAPKTGCTALCNHCKATKCVVN